MGCRGTAMMRCRTCKGTGQCTRGCTAGRVSSDVFNFDVACMACGGSAACAVCSGTGPDMPGLVDCDKCEEGQDFCGSCRGSGFASCHECEGHRMVKCSSVVKATYTAETSTHCETTSDIPEKIMKRARGDTVIDRTDRVVTPLIRSGDPKIDIVSNDLSTRHKKLYHTEDSAIVQQTHTLSVIPIHKVTAKHSGNKTWTFYLLGNDYLVYVPNYPGRRCCKVKCSIM